MNCKTLKEIYNEKRQKPTPAQDFIKEIAHVTHKTELTVRNWISGRQIPDELTIEVLAKHLGTEPSFLFTKSEKI